MGLRLDKKEELIERILRNMEHDLVSYKDYFIGLAEKNVRKWSDEDFLNWLPDDEREDYNTHITLNRKNGTK